MPTNLYTDKRLTCTAASFHDLYVVSFTDHSTFPQGELLAGAELAFAVVAGEAGQMEHVVTRSSHPIGGVDAAQALRTLGAEFPDGCKGWY